MEKPLVDEFCHQSVLLEEVLSSLKPRSDGRYLDGTLGGAGHATAILDQSSPNGWLWGCDQDADAIEAARARLNERFAGRFEIRQCSFADIGDWVPERSCDGVLLDLGVSSPQLDRAARGFSFQKE